LRHTVQWSYDLLESFEQSVLQQVSVFAGGFTLPAAVAVCGGDGLDEFDMLDALDSLVRKSLLQLERSDGDVRYEMLETIRQFAEEALADTGDSDAVRDRHARYFADEVAVAYDQWQTDKERHVYRWVDNEITNLAAALDWAVARSQVDPAVRIAANTHHIARNRLRTETFDWPEQVIDLARRTQHRQLPHLLAEACDAANGVGRLGDAVRYGLEAIALNDDDDSYDFSFEAYFKTAFAMVASGQFDQAMQVVRVGAEHPADAPVRGNLAYLHVFAAMLDVAIPDDERAAAIAQIKASPMPAIRGVAPWVQAILATDVDVRAAIDLYEQAIDIAVECGGRSLEESCRGQQLGLLTQTDDLDAALTGFSRSVDTWQVMADVYARMGVFALVTWLAGLGYHDGAARLLGAINRGLPAYAGHGESATKLAPEIVALPKLMGEAEFEAAYEAGIALDPRAAAELAHQLLATVRAERLDESGPL
jgi:tetratricopeptide (TPR) repeat protein